MGVGGGGAGRSGLGVEKPTLSKESELPVRSPLKHCIAKLPLLPSNLAISSLLLQLSSFFTRILAIAAYIGSCHQLLPCSGLVLLPNLTMAVFLKNAGP